MCLRMSWGVAAHSEETSAHPLKLLKINYSLICHFVFCHFVFGLEKPTRVLFAILKF